ncbi:MAG: hypothetical protein HY549_00025 [Elusimicrobia bacterium]|nr:hypothetical protein [Elusimicrobiota bacterium]
MTFLRKPLAALVAISLIVYSTPAMAHSASRAGWAKRAGTRINRVVAQWRQPYFRTGAGMLPSFELSHQTERTQAGDKRLKTADPPAAIVPAAQDSSMSSPAPARAVSLDLEAASLDSLREISNVSFLRTRAEELLREFRPRRLSETSPESALSVPASLSGMELSAPAKPPQGEATAKPEPPAPEQSPAAEPAPVRRGWFGLGFVPFAYIGSHVVAQVGIESFSAAMPFLLERTLGDFSFITDITITASLASIIGRILGPWVIERLGRVKTEQGAVVVQNVGLLKTYRYGLLALLAAKIALSTLLAMGAMPLMGLVAFYAVTGLLGGMVGTVERILPSVIVGKKAEALENFGAWRQLLSEIVGVIGPIATGAMIASAGFLPALIAGPLATAISIAIIWMTLRLPHKQALLGQLKLMKDQPRAPATSIVSLFKEFGGKIAHGFNVIWKDRALRTASYAFTIFMILNPLVYNLAPAYGIRLMGRDNPQAPAVQGMIPGLYSLGGLFSGVIMVAEQGRLRKNPAGDAEKEELLRRSMLKWMFWTIPTLVAFAAMALSLPTLGAWLTLPGWLAWAGLGAITLPALLFIPFGIAQVTSIIKVESFIQAKTRQEDLSDAMGFLGSASLAISTIALASVRFLLTGKLPFGIQPFAFAGLAGLSPFWVIAGAMPALGLLIWWLSRRLRTLSQPAPKN